MSTDTTTPQSGETDNGRRGLVHLSSCATTAYYDEMAAVRYEARLRAEAEAAQSN